jgi:hypothetical protein
MNAIAKQAEPVKLPTEANTIASLIERVATNPNTSIDTLERLLNMQERVETKRAEAAFNAALADMQPVLPVIAERGEIMNSANKVQSTYARWEDINDAIKPILAQYGFALTFRVDRPEGMVCITGVLSHREGHSTQTTISLPVDSSGSKNGVQAVGSSTSYGQRYTAKLLLNLTSRGDDDDGKSGGMGAAALKAISDINMCDTLDQLRTWKAQHFEGVSKLVSEQECREIVALCNTRAKRLKGEA